MFTGYIFQNYPQKSILAQYSLLWVDIVCVMMKGFKIIIAFLLILSIAGCTKKRYEWVKINPEKLHLAKTAKPYSENVRKVNIYISARQKAEILVYDEADTFFQENVVEPTSPLKVNPKQKKSNIVKSALVRKSNLKRNNTAMALVKPAPLVKKNKEFKQVKAAKPVVKEKTDEEMALSKLNSALILPKKKPKPQVAKEVVAVESPNPKSQARQEASVSEIFSEQTSNQKPQTAPTTSKVVADNKPSNTAQQEVVNSNSDDIINAQEEELKNTEEDSFKLNNYMWVGLVLVIIGLIIGLVFGGMAYFISVVGVVFLLIGYFYKV